MADGTHEADRGRARRRPWCSRATAAATCAPRASPTPSRRDRADGIRIRTRGGPRDRLDARAHALRRLRRATARSHTLCAAAGMGAACTPLRCATRSRSVRGFAAPRGRAESDCDYAGRSPRAWVRRSARATPLPFMPRRRSVRAWRCSPKTAATTSSSRSSASSSIARSTTSTSRARTTSSPPALVTHNSIYGFRGADITQHPRFPGRLPRRRRSCASSRTTARRRRSSAPPTRSSRTTAGGWASRCGPTSARATRSRSASSRTSTPRRGSWWGRSSGSSTRASRARRSRSSTGPTRSRGCSRTRSCAARSATRSSAARSSTSAPRSRTRSPT